MPTPRNAPELKLLLGVEARHREVKSPTAAAREPEPSPDLTPPERKVWDHLVAELREMGTLSSADAIAMTALSQATVLAERMHARIATAPELTVTTETGMVHVHPLLTAYDVVQRRILALTTALGLTPVGRSRIHGQAAGKPNTEAAHTPDLYAI